MYTLLESKAEIQKAITTLDQTIRRDFKKIETREITWRRGKENGVKSNPGPKVERVYTNGSCWYGSFPIRTHHSDGRPALTPKHAHWFGIYKDTGSLNIAVEINTPFEGRHDSAAGFFARNNDTGKIFLFHSGRVGGGKPGVGKTPFLAWNNTGFKTVVDSTQNTKEGVLVMPIVGNDATNSAIRFMQSVVDFKKAVSDGDTNTPEFARRESWLRDILNAGRSNRKGTRKTTTIDYESHHDEVVVCLKNWRERQPLPNDGFCIIGETDLIDMAVSASKNPKDAIEVYEVKSGTDRQSLYTAIGQVIVHGALKQCRRIVVVPVGKPIAADILETLRRMRIEILKYRFDTQKSKAEFQLAG